ADLLDLVCAEVLFHVVEPRSRRRLANLRYHSSLPMRIAFVVADVTAQSPTYGTLYLARAALRRGHEALFVGVDELTFSPQGRVPARAVRAPGSPDTTAELAAQLAAPEARPEGGGAPAGSAGRSGGIHPPARMEEHDLSACDVVFLRYNPT